jgi:sulfite reductase alpha subunit-like flavoprotein
VNAEVPQFVPSPVTARYLFSHLLDFRALPKKSVLRSLAENCSREKEKRRLLELSSKQVRNLVGVRVRLGVSRKEMLL